MTVLASIPKGANWPEVNRYFRASAVSASAIMKRRMLSSASFKAPASTPTSRPSKLIVGKKSAVSAYQEEEDMAEMIQKSSAIATKIMRDNKRKQRVTPITEDAPAGNDTVTAIDTTHSEDPQDSGTLHSNAEHPPSPSLPSLTPIGSMYPALRGKKIVLEALPSSPTAKARLVAEAQPPHEVHDQHQTDIPRVESSSTTELLGDIHNSSSTMANTPTTTTTAHEQTHEAVVDTGISPTSVPRSTPSPLQRHGSDTQQEATAASETEGEGELELSHMIAKIRDSAVTQPKHSVNLERQQLKGTRLLHPQEPFILTWQFIVGIGILYSIIVVPLRLGFDYDATGSWYLLEFIIDGFFMIDIVLNFRTAFFNEERLLVFDPRVIFWRYAKSWFLVDLVSTVPIDELVRYVDVSLSAHLLLLSANSN
jgi:hypothetical protein